MPLIVQHHTPGPLCKPEPIQRTKARQRRQEAAVLRSVRAAVMARDQGCRAQFADVGRCQGRVTLAHLRRRSATMGRPATERHCVEEAICLCLRHHALEETHRLRWAYLTDAKASGAMTWILL